MAVIPDPDRIYWEDSSDLRKLPRRSYDFWMGDITWERMTYTESTYRQFLKELFEGGYSDRNELLDARVLYLGDAHAVIHAKVLFSQTTELRGEESHEYDL